MSDTRREWRALFVRLWPWLLLALVFVLFRVPAILNAGWVNSDGAVTGLQALQIPRGENHWLHWSRSYLTSIDSLMLVPFFAVFGANPWTMVCVSMLGQFVATGFSFAALKRRLGAPSALVAVAPLVLMTMALNIYLFFGIRTWCVSMALSSVFLSDGASESKRPWLRYAFGTATAVFAVFLDLYAIQFLPGLLLFAVLCCFDGERNFRLWGKRLAVVVGTGAVSYGAVLVLRRMANVVTDRAGLDPGRIPINLKLLLDTCLPWVTGEKVFAVMDPSPVEQPVGPVFALIEKAGLTIFLAALVFGAGSFFWRRIPWEKRRLGALGSALATVSLLGFLSSGTVTDVWASRMLLPLVFGAAFALAPASHLLQGWRLPLVLSPYLFSTLVAGWLSYGFMVDGPLPVISPRGGAKEELALGQLLRDRGIHYATGHYWLAYRLTFLFHEDPIVVPLDSEDRYPRYKREFDVAPVVAFIFHPSQPWQPSAPYESLLTQRQIPFEKLEVEGFTVFIVRRSP